LSNDCSFNLNLSKHMRFLEKIWGSPFKQKWKNQVIIVLIIQTLVLALDVVKNIQTPF